MSDDHLRCASLLCMKSDALNRDSASCLAVVIVQHSKFLPLQWTDKQPSESLPSISSPLLALTAGRVQGHKYQ
jgi:hypothetical protein